MAGPADDPSVHLCTGFLALCEGDIIFHATKNLFAGYWFVSATTRATTAQHERIADELMHSPVTRSIPAHL